MTEKEAIRIAFQTGHFWSPDNPDGPNVEPSDLPTLTGRDDVAKRAIHSFQKFMAPEHARACLRVHGRTPNFDGEFGKATDQTFLTSRCPVPDFPPPPGATFHYTDPDLQAVVESMQQPATGTGSWPSNCTGQHEGIHVVTYHVNPNGRPYSEERWNKNRKRVLAAYRDIGMLQIEVDDSREAQIRLSWRAGNGWIGLAQFNSGRCSDSVFHYEDTRYAPADDDLLQKLNAHEDGHNHRVNHITNDPIMHPAIRRGAWNGSFRGTSFGNVLIRYFSGVAIPDGPNPPPPPEPPVDLEGRLEDLARQSRIQDAVHDALLEFHGDRISVLEGT